MDRPGWVARTVTVAVMGGAMALSYAGIAAAVQPAAGALRPVYPLVLDGAALMGLYEVLSARRSRTARAWAWGVLLIAGSTSVGLNTWHALSEAGLPVPVAVAYGTVPVLLAYGLSHLVAIQSGVARPHAEVRTTVRGPAQASASTAVPAEAPAAARPARGPSKNNAVRELTDAIRADPAWRPDYNELMREGWSRRWWEQRVSEARAEVGRLRAA
ncbi:MAG: hypothetical protein ACRDMV_25110 [Streptosporangiales bacterium]